MPWEQDGSLQESTVELDQFFLLEPLFLSEASISSSMTICVGTYLTWAWSCPLKSLMGFNGKPEQAKGCKRHIEA